MPVYNGSTKQGTLYYGGNKIKEAYYGSTKVYSSGPLYYCYRSDVWGYWAYVYIVEKPTVAGNITCYQTDNPLNQASTSSDLHNIYTYSIKNVTDNQFQYVDGGSIAYYYPSGDLYT